MLFEAKAAKFDHMANPKTTRRRTEAALIHCEVEKNPPFIFSINSSNNVLFGQLVARRHLNEFPTKTRTLWIFVAMY